MAAVVVQSTVEVNGIYIVDISFSDFKLID